MGENESKPAVTELAKVAVPEAIAERARQYASAKAGEKLQALVDQRAVSKALLIVSSVFALAITPLIVHIFVTGAPTADVVCPLSFLLLMGGVAVFCWCQLMASNAVKNLPRTPEEQTVVDDLLSLATFNASEAARQVNHCIDVWNLYVRAVRLGQRKESLQTGEAVVRLNEWRKEVDRAVQIVLLCHDAEANEEAQKTIGSPGLPFALEDLEASLKRLQADLELDLDDGLEPLARERALDDIEADLGERPRLRVVSKE